jgi:hypothetical protein
MLVVMRGESSDLIQVVCRLEVWSKRYAIVILTAQNAQGASSCVVPDQDKPSEGPVANSRREGISRVTASPGRRAGSGVRVCASCGITQEALEPGKLKECGGCKSAQYCGKACQKADWPAHKATCKRLQAAQG